MPDWWDALDIDKYPSSSGFRLVSLHHKAFRDRHEWERFFDRHFHRCGGSVTAWCAGIVWPVVYIRCATEEMADTLVNESSARFAKRGVPLPQRAVVDTTTDSSRRRRRSPSPVDDARQSPAQPRRKTYSPPAAHIESSATAVNSASSTEGTNGILPLPQFHESIQQHQAPLLSVASSSSMSLSNHQVQQQQVLAAVLPLLSGEERAAFLAALAKNIAVGMLNPSALQP